jgi:Mg/Co/Ni transporter MgtE
MTVEEAISEIRQQAGQVEMIFYAYVLDEYQHLLGIVSFRELLSAERSRTIRDLMRKDYVFVLEDADKETVAQLLARNGTCSPYRYKIKRDGWWASSPVRMSPAWFNRKQGKTF